MLRGIFFLFTLFLYGYTRMPASYSDYYARYKLWPMSEIFVYKANLTDINQYLGNCFFNYTFYKHVVLPCDLFGTNRTDIECAGSIVASHDDGAIILVFRGTIGNNELNEEEVFYNITVPFPGGGTVDKFYYQGLQIIWNGGLRDALFAAKNAFPTYELWITGWSMGASLASMAAPYISHLGYFDPANIKMVSFSALRVGDKVFADRYPTLVPYSYRVTHRNDIVPHLIPSTAGYSHHITEIWYNNNMTEGEPFTVCSGQESPNCSDSVASNMWTWNDHPCFGATFTIQSTCKAFTQPPTA